MKIGYARVSTEEQSLQLQIDALTEVGCEKIFRDRGVSGVAQQRKGLDRARKYLKKGDVLIVWKLDRLGRSLRFLIDLIEELGGKEVGFQSLSDGINTTTPGGELVFHVIGAIAQFERSLISERTRAGMHAARRKGQHVGRPFALTDKQIMRAHEKIVKENATITELVRKLGCTKDTLARGIKRLGLEG